MGFLFGTLGSVNVSQEEVDKAMGLAMVLAVSLGLALVFYLLVYRTRPRDEEVAGRNPTIITSQFWREFWYWYSYPALRVLLWLRITPDGLSITSLFVAAVGGVAFGLGMIFYGGVLLLASGAMDTLDGRLARKLGTASDSGAYLDSVIDRYADFFAYSGLLFYFGFHPEFANRITGNSQQMEVIRLGCVGIILACMLGSSLISYAKERGANLGATHNRGLMQRADRVTVLGLATLFDPLSASIEREFWSTQLSSGLHGTTLLGLGLIAVLSNTTAVHRVHAIYSLLKESNTNVTNKQFKRT